jgi:hypothetical protein
MLYRIDALAVEEGGMSSWSRALVPVGLIMVTACSGGGSSGDGGGSGRLSMGVTDGPTEWADKVVISFDSVELQGPERQLIEFDTLQTVDLLSYQGDERFLLLDNLVLPAGHYPWMRLSVMEGLAYSYIEIEGVQHALRIPSGAQSGLKMNRGFTIAVGGLTDVTIDFVLPKSVHDDGGGDYVLRPTVRLVDNMQINTIHGTVETELVENPACANGDSNDVGNAVYLYAGADAVVQDMRGDDNDPLTMATVEYDGDSNNWVFKIGFVPFGDYTVAFTCDAALDSDGEYNSDAMSLSDGFNVTVAEGDPSRVDIVAPL